MVESRGKAVESGRFGVGEWESEVVAAARSPGEIYEKGAVGVVEDFRRAAKFYRVGTEKKCAESTRRLGYLYSRGAGVEENSLKARELYERAALSGNLEAVFNLRETCMRSNLVDDWLLAFDLLQAAGDLGHGTPRCLYRRYLYLKKCIILNEDRLKSKKCPSERLPIIDID